MVITPRDRGLMRSIYDCRCLSTGQIFKLFFDENTNQRRYCQYRLSELVKNEYLETIKNPCEEFAFQLTKKGVNLVIASCDIPDRDMFGLKTHFTAKELSIALKSLEHQLATNDLMVHFRKNLPGDWVYIDGKHHHLRNGNFRPDAVLETEQAEFFLEMDMSTEPYSEITNKFQRFNYYCTHYKKTKKKQVIVVFVNHYAAINRVQKIKNIAKKELAELTKDGKVDVLVGTKTDLLDFMVNDYIPNTIEYTLPDNILKVFGHYGFKPVFTEGLNISYYPKVLFDSNGARGVKSFFLQCYNEYSLESLMRVSKYDEIRDNGHVDRKTPLAVVCQSKIQIRNLLSDIGYLPKALWFTTNSLLISNDFPKFFKEPKDYMSCGN